MFDRVWHATLWAIMRLHNINDNLTRTIGCLDDKATSAVCYDNNIGELDYAKDVCSPQHPLKDRDTDRQTDRQTDRETDREADRQTDRQRDRQRGRQTDRQTERQTDRQTGRQAGRQTDRQIDRQNFVLTNEVDALLIR